MKKFFAVVLGILCTVVVANNVTQTQEAGEPYVDHGATAVDQYAVDITAKIVTTGAVNVAALGAYTITYNVSDSDGNAADPAVRTVVVKDTKPPTITLKGPATIKVLRGTPALNIPGLGAMAADSFAGACPVTLVWVPALDTTKAGTYVCTYGAKDPSGNSATPVIQTVVVWGKPIITIRP